MTSHMGGGVCTKASYGKALVYEKNAVPEEDAYPDVPRDSYLEIVFDTSDNRPIQLGCTFVDSGNPAIDVGSDALIEIVTPKLSTNYYRRLPQETNNFIIDPENNPKITVRVYGRWSFEGHWAGEEPIIESLEVVGTCPIVENYPLTGVAAFKRCYIKKALSYQSVVNLH